MAELPPRVADDVGGEFLRASEFAEVWVVHVQRADIVLEEADRLQGMLLVAVPEQLPFNPVRRRQ